MKSLEHIIREIREGKCECEKKKDSLEHAIRKVARKEYESSYAAKDSKPVEEDIGGLVGSGTGGEPKLHAEDGKKKKDVKEAIGTLGTDKYQGNEFKSIRTATPHIKPPGPEHGHSQAPENASRQRSIAKEKAGINRVTEEEKIDEVVQFAAMAAPYIAPLIGATAAGVAGYMATKGKGKLPSFSSYDPEKAKQNDSYGTAAGRMKAMKFKETPGVETPPAPPPTAPTRKRPGKYDEPVPGEIPDPSKPVEPKKAPEKPAEEKPKAPPVTVPSPKPAEVPQEPPAKAIPAPKTPQPEIPPPLPAQTTPGKETKTAPKTPVPETPTELPKKWKEVGPEMPSAKPEVAPAAEPSTKTKTAVQPSGVVHPTTGANIAANAGRAAVAPKTDTAVNTKTAADVETKTTTTTDEPGKQLPSFGGAAVPHAIDYTASHLTRPKVGAGHAKAHKKHAMREAIEAAIERKKIENMPRKGDRKSIEYVGRNDAEPKTSKEKTSRLATIRNVIDEAKKEIAKKINYEDGKTKVFDYGKDILIINPDQKRIDMDVDGNKIPKDYDNK